MACGVTRSLDVSGQRRPDIKLCADVKAPHLTPISTQRPVTEKQWSEEHLRSDGIQLPQLTPLPPNLYCFSSPAAREASVLHCIRQEGDQRFIIHKSSSLPHLENTKKLSECMTHAQYLPERRNRSWQAKSVSLHGHRC